MCPEAESNHASLVGLVNCGEFLGEIAFRDVGSVGMKDVNDELAPSQETVGDKFSRADGYWGVGLTDRKDGSLSVYMLTHLTGDGAIHPLPPLSR